jgi:hypothetical protein
VKEADGNVQRRSWIRAHRGICGGLIATALYVAALASILPPSWITQLRGGIALNEIGDFLGGVFAPLAFLWLVVGILQQQEEITQNTRALFLQEKALQEQVSETRALVGQGREELDRTKRLQRPAMVLDFRGQIVPAGAGGVFLPLQLENRGARARQVRMEGRALDQNHPQVAEADALNREDRLDLMLRVPQVLGIYEIETTYRDDFETRYRRVFRVYASNAQIESMPEEELPA